MGTFFRALVHPEFNWGDPSTVGRFVAHFTGSQYGDLAGNSLFAARGDRLPALLASELGLPALLLAFLGIWKLVRKGRLVLLGLALLAATAVFGLTYNIPDFRVHLLPSFVALALLAGAGATWLEESLARRKPALGAFAAVVVLAAPGFMLFLNYPAAAENRTTIVQDLGSNLLVSLPQDAIFVAGSDVSANAVRYLQVVRRIRPDALVVSADMLFSMPYHKWLSRRFALPDYETYLRAAGNGSRPERRQRLLSQLVDAAGQRPVLLGTELMSQDFFSGPLTRQWQVAPNGIVNRLLPARDTVPVVEFVSANRRLWDSYRMTAVRSNYSSPEYQQIQVVYAAARNNLGMFCLDHGWRDPAIENIRAALELPAPPDVRRVFEANLDRAEARSN